MTGADDRCAAGDACLDVDVALAFVDGTLAPGRRADVEHRIDVCARCRAVVAAAARADTSSQPTISARRAWRRAKSQPSASDLAPGAQLGRYVIERPLGAGGMGVVHLARDPELRRAVVIKLVRPDAFTGEDRDDLEHRLRREAQAMAQLSHPNVVQIFDIGHHGDRVFLAMEFVSGPTLDSWLIERARSADDILAMFRQAGAGLAAAHRAGLVHRDFKPANVLVTGDGVAKVTDFGLSRGIHPGQVPGRETLALPRASGIHTVLTHVDAVVGTPAYMAPEQADGRAVDARSDQYAFAVALVDALVGQNPMKRTLDVTERTRVTAALEAAKLGPRARAAIVRALEPDPAQRFATLDALLAELAPAHQVRWWPIAGGVALCGVAIALWFVTRTEAAPACVPDAPKQWTADARTRLVAAFAAMPPPPGTPDALGLPRPFAGWTGAAIAGELDRAVTTLGAAEVARCQHQPTVDDACLAHRERALGETIAALPGALDAPWPLVRGLDRCDAAPVATTTSRRELRETIAREPDASRAIARAEQLAEQARTAGDDALAGDALEVAATRAVATHDMVAAERLLRALAATGERAGDDAVRARALLQLLEVARWNGEHAAAVRDDDTLASLLARHGNAARDVLPIALQEAATFTDVGDAARALAAWDRAIAAAQALAAADAELVARTGHALAHDVLRFDREAARRELAAALGTSKASAPIRAEALVVAADLALDADDAAATKAYLADAHALDPSRASGVRDRIRLARLRALAGDPDGALDDLVKLRATLTDLASPILVDVARAEILRRAGRLADANDVLTPSYYAIRPFAPGQATDGPRLALADRLAVAREHCTLAVARQTPMGCQYELVTGLHPHAPQKVRFALGRLDQARQQKLDMLAVRELESVLETYREVDAPALAIADVHWQLAQNAKLYDERARREHAIAARAIYEAAHRDAEVAAIDQLLGGGVAPAGSATGSADPWATAP
ncbi:MAG TPA: serine/threonine-protein kinase [Kofleriaceae bacterium]|nr:serine/threonine-protein kinase [Kofleriaceae bacterium]